MQDKIPVPPSPEETPLEIVPGFDIYSAIVGILLLVIVFRTKRN